MVELCAPQAVVFAGGRGIRMGTITEKRQKCLLPIDGKPVLGHVLDSISAAFGSAKVVVCVSYCAQDVVRFVEHNKPRNIHAEYVWDKGDSRTADILRPLQGKVKGPFVATSGDIFVRPSAYSQGYKQAQQEGVLGSVALSPKTDEAPTHAIAETRDQKVINYVYPRPPVLERCHLTDISVWAFSYFFLKYLDYYQQLGMVSQLLKQAVIDQEQIIANLYKESWVHLAYPQDLSKTMSA